MPRRYRYRDELELDCKQCRHFNAEENNCGAFTCTPFTCDDPLPCEKGNNHIKTYIYGENKWKKRRKKSE